MNIKRQFNRVLIALDAYFRGQQKNRIKNNTPADKTVLIVFQQIFGDSIVIQDSLKEYVKIFPKIDGYTVKFLARPSVIAFMKATEEIPTEIELEAVDFSKFLEEYEYYKEIVNKYKGMADTLIVPGTSLSAEIFCAASDAYRKVGLVRCIDVSRPITMTIFAKLAYNERVRPDKSDMMLQRHRLLINYLGNEDYKAKLPSLLPKVKVIYEEHYCVLSPGSSKKEKCWPTERFSEVTDYIIENYGMNVHLCGGTDEMEFGKLILSRVKYPENVFNHIGKTSFSDWSAIVQHADLVVGNDSATMHLAAASRRKSICIAGVYDKYQFFPYKVDKLNKGDRLPVTVMEDMPCKWCRTVGYDAGHRNPKCKAKISQKECSLCIDAITVQAVETEIERLMEEHSQ